MCSPSASTARTRNSAARRGAMGQVYAHTNATDFTVRNARDLAFASTTRSGVLAEIAEESDSASITAARASAKRARCAYCVWK